MNNTMQFNPLSSMVGNNNNSSMISNGTKNSTIKPTQNKGPQGIMNPKTTASGVKTTSVSIVGGGIPKP